MKKILIAAPFTAGDLFVGRWVTPSFGLWRLSSFLNAHGHYCKVYDCNEPGCKEFKDVLLEDNWDTIGFSVLSATIEYDISKMIEAKRLCPNSLLVAGGSGAALEYQSILDKTPIDLVTLTEGEFALLDICNGKNFQEIEGIVFKKKSKILDSSNFWEITETLDIKNMPMNKYWKKTASFYENPDYNEINTFRLFTSNYCTRGCNFCTLTLWRKYASGKICPIVGLSPEQIIEMINRILKVYPQCKQIFFTDDDFFMLKKRGEDFCRKVIELKERDELPKDLRFICLTNINAIDKDNIEIISKAGFRVLSVGVESVSQNKLNGMNKKQTVQKIWENTDLILQHNIKPYYTLILWTPESTIEDLIVDLKGFRKFSRKGVGISVEPYLIPLAGTTYWEEFTPMDMRWVNIEGTNQKIKKGFAWLPKGEIELKVFRRFVQVYAKYKKYIFELDKHIKHKEKNYQGHIILNALEIVLREFGYTVDIEVDNFSTVQNILSQMKDYDVDIVGDIKEKESWKF